MAVKLNDKQVKALVSQAGLQQLAAYTLGSAPKEPVFGLFATSSMESVERSHQRNMVQTLET